VSATFDTSITTTTITVEFGFGSGAFAASPTWTDVSTDVRTISIDRGRSALDGKFQPGSATIVLDNLDGDFDPNNTSGSYHPDVKIGTPIRVQATTNSNTHTLFVGSVNAWRVGYPVSGKDSLVTVDCGDRSNVIAQTVETWSLTVGQGTDDFIGSVLDDVGWPAGARSLDAGDASTYSGFTAGNAADGWGLINQAVDVEGGWFYIAADGTATFRKRTDFTGASTPWTGGLTYTSVAVDYADDFLFNRAEMTGPSGTAQTDEDTSTTSQYGKLTRTVTSDLFADDSAAANLAEVSVDRYADVLKTVTVGTRYGASTDVSYWDNWLTVDLTRYVRVMVDPVGGGTDLDMNGIVTAISHQIDPRARTWDLTLQVTELSDYDTTQYWVLGTSTLGTDTTLA